MPDISALLASWSSASENDLLNALLPHVRNASDTSSSAALYDAFHTLTARTISSLSPPGHIIKPADVASFVHKLVNQLPSSSSAPDHATTNAIDETLVDVLWALDTHIDDIIQDAVAVERAANAPKKDGDATMATDQDADRLANAKAKRASADADRATLAEVVKLLLQNNVVQLATCRARLDFGLLVLVGLVNNKAALEKKEVQTKTRLFYRQNKFNLLREQSEGYTKLSVELIASIGPAHSSDDAKPVESPEHIRARAAEVWDKVVSLVGYFDLDPNRVLDIILDVFSYNIYTHHSFFLELLRCSPWCGGAADGTAHPVDVEMDSSTEGSKYAGLSFDNVLRVARGLPVLHDVGDEMDVDDDTADKPPTKKAPVCAQVLGFKYKYFQTSGRDVPKSLSYLAAFLIREHVITIDDLLPHLYPDDTEMAAEKEKFDKDIVERISNARASALAMAAPLAADEPSIKPRTTTSSDPKKKDDKKDAADKEKDKPKDPPNQRLSLLQALLALGALEPAFDILSHVPWLPSASPEVAELLLRLAHHSLNPLYESTVNRHERYHQAVMGAKAKFSPTSGLVPAAAKKLALTAYAPTPPSTATTDYVFFYPQWSEWVPVCRQHSDVRDVVEPILRFVGVQVFRDPEFMTKLCRVGKTQVCVSHVSDEVCELWVRISRLYLLPGMSMLNNNTTISAELWPILRVMDATTRWGLYGEWATHMYKVYPEMRVRKVEAEREAKAIMRRLSTKTVTTLNRSVAKLAHCNPCILFAHMVNQVQAYDNMAEVVVESLKFCALMPFDVLLFIVLETLANPDKERLKDDGISVSQWLQSLASFIGILCRRYQQVDCSLILRYVVNRLRAQEVMEIIVLRELIAKMTGMQPPENMSEQQIVALSGGPILRIEAIASETRGILLEKPLLHTRAMERFMTGLNSQGMAKALLVLIAKQRQLCLFTSSNVRHLKALSTLYDSVHQVLTLFIDCLATGLSPSVYSALLPSYKDLCQKYSMDPYMAIQIYRPKLHKDIVAHIQARSKESAEEAERRLKAALAAKREPSASSADTKGASTPDPTKSNPVKEEKPVTNGSTDSPMDAEPSPWLPLLEPVIRDAEEVLGPRVAELMGAPFFVTFWQLGLYDVNPPNKRYDEERTRHTTLLKKTSDAIADVNTKSARVRELKTRKERIAASFEALGKEYSTMASNFEFTMKRLAREKQHWFPAATERSQELVQQILQHCIMPRALISPMDADFCSHFIKIVHERATPSFHTLRIYDKIFNDGVSSVVYSCTENEARNLGRFLRNALQDLKAWSDPKSDFLEQTIKGSTSLLPGFQKQWNATATSFTASDVVDKSVMRLLLRKWHMKLGVGLTQCVDGTEYMQIYNAIIILKELLPVMPRTDTNFAIGTSIHDCMKRCIAKETREDLKVLAQAYMAHLLKVRDTWDQKEAKPKPAPASAAQRTSGSSDAKARPSTTMPSGTSATTSTSTSRNAASSTSSTSKPQASSTAPSASTDGKASSTKSALDSIPRPEVVKRVARNSSDASPKASPKPEGANGQRRDDKPADAAKSTTAPPVRPAGLPTKPEPAPRSSQNGTHSALKEPASPIRQPPPAGGQRREPPASPRGHRQQDDPARPQTQVMPPPAAPSQTTAAQDMRARATRDDRERNDTRAASRGPPPRSSSPPSRRPSPTRGNGRNGAQDTSGAGPRAERDGDRSRAHPEAPSRAALHGREGHGDSRDVRDARERPPSGRARDDDRGSDDRSRDRDRHHAPDSRDREHASRDGRSTGTARPEDDARGSDPARRLSGASSAADESASKRRRHGEDEAQDRSSKRSSSSRHGDKESGGHRDREERTSRSHRREKERTDKDKDKERDRRESSEKRSHRKDRDGRDDTERERESRPAETSEKTLDKSTRPSDSSAGNGKAPAVPPSGPRAMAVPDAPRTNRADAPAPSTSRAADANRDNERQPANPPATQPAAAQPQQTGTPSLRDRLGGFQAATPERNAGNTSGKEEGHSENRGMKRNLADRTGGRDAEAEGGTPPHKRPKLQRQRYPLNAGQLDKERG
ncbi:hypothetical protein EXIGLDRAFT_715906 [Exidia glandulosa HHB12029]|uniref:THO complex subunit 2 n=1 Tax=Exidia glandulosa HHB12029 TaxID=1314781 RepID=A0A165QNN8_EXIGL|nr:hypothetical protein EXIGLDRAFT_715906 [Exidia glandulosa HHB12029]